VQQAPEEFVTDIVISEENDPRSVTAITLREIANRFRAKGDLENAKRYIDKAVAAGGNLYYTGYSMRITHRSIHGESAKGLDEFAQLGANHRGHQGRELVQVLIGELYCTKHFEEAKRTTRFLEKAKDVQSSLRHIAVEQAKQGDTDAADRTIEEISDGQERQMARLGIVQVLWKSGKQKTARTLVDSAYRDAKDETKSPSDAQYQRLAYVYGLLTSTTAIKQILTEANAPDQKAYRLMNAIQGFAESRAAP